MSNEQRLPLVTEDDPGIRPAGSPVHCYYCNRGVGQEHKRDCVILSKKVKLRATVEYEVYVPFEWDKEMIEFHRNDGTWCADNLVNDLEKHLKGTEGCLCDRTKIDFVEVVEAGPVIKRDRDY